MKNPDPSSFLVCSIFLLWYDGIAIKKRVDVFEAKGVRMTRKYRLKRTAFIGCRNTAYMDVDDAEPCPFCGSRQVTIYPYGQGTTSYVEGVPTLYLSSATCKCRGCTAEIDGPQRKSIIEGEDEYNACIAALKTWNTRHADKEA
ncbi:Lar family restriction alleviation protein [Coprococcus comes]|uniref:Lar family restriction alleviation protein n=1 Tax=Coprococcus comes TaxID=410072 RepID=UPI0018992547|nr:Lar family restriction alleviation protein [Coprococcus comes]